MNKLFTFLIATYLLLLCSCSPRITANIEVELPILEDNAEVLIYGLKNEPPASSLYVGSLNSGKKYDHSAYSNPCDYDDVAIIVRKQARKYGANIIKINEIVYPSFGSPCIELKTSLYYVESTKNIIDDSFYKKEKTGATIHFMRPYSKPGSGVFTKIYENDSMYINHVVSGFVYHHNTKNTGETSFYVEGNEEEKVILEIEDGEEYFIMIDYHYGWVRTYFKIKDVTDYYSLKHNRKMMAELISKYPKDSE